VSRAAVRLGNGGGAGICTYAAAVSKLNESRAFLVKLLMGATFGVFIDSSGLHYSATKSAAFVEALWRRRERVPGARDVTWRAARVVDQARDSLNRALMRRNDQLPVVVNDRKFENPKRGPLNESAAARSSPDPTHTQP
jgi:hypothetical protein